MNKEHSEQEKQQAIELIRSMNGNVSAAARISPVSRRTMASWWEAVKAEESPEAANLLTADEPAAKNELDSQTAIQRLVEIQAAVAAGITELLTIVRNPKRTKSGFQFKQLVTSFGILLDKSLILAQKLEPLSHQQLRVSYIGATDLADMSKQLIDLADAQRKGYCLSCRATLPGWKGEKAAPTPN